MQVASTFPRQTTWTGYISCKQSMENKHNCHQIRLCPGYAILPWRPFTALGLYKARSHNKSSVRGGLRHPCHQWWIISIISPPASDLFFNLRFSILVMCAIFNFFALGQCYSYSQYQFESIINDVQIYKSCFG